ncbi:YopX family protein [Priestia flexa]|uniref:YopX family protein n=1 Tax=Priestia flexa TaxID=86664 RepID=UPI003F84FC9C
MREIKFRGYAVPQMVNGQWLYGFGVSAIEYAEHYAKEIGREKDWYLYTDNGTIHVREKSVGQYTGLKDKNGKGIYEGDILKCHHKTLGKVFFHDGSYRLSSDQCELNLDDIRSYDNLDHYLIEDNNLVVIGNIFENPSLLEAAE